MMTIQLTSTPPSALGSMQKEVIKRRLAIAKAEMLQEQSVKEEGKRRCISKSQATNEPLKPTPESFLNACQNTGRFRPSGSITRPSSASCSDSTAHYIYSEISLPVNENLMKPFIEFSSKGSAVESTIFDMLLKGDNADKYIRGDKKVAFDGALLLDNFIAKKERLKNIRLRDLIVQAKSKRSGEHMSMRQFKKCGTLGFSEGLYCFDILKPMHDIWKEYIMESLAKIGKKQLLQRILTLDLHGAVLHVVTCKISSFKGVNGIMFRETAETFGIITMNNRLRVVPKRGSVFIFQAGSWKITLHGDKFISRSLA